MFERLRWGAICGLALLIGAPAGAVDLGEKISIHGYGGWAAGSSNSYTYLQGDERSDPETHNAVAALHFDFTPTDKIRFTVVPVWDVSDAEESVDLDVAAVTWDVADRTKLHFGRSRLPFGIYTDIFDIGTLRPLFNLAQSVYGPTGLITEFYDGIGSSGTLFSAGGWEGSYDVYGGGASFTVEVPFEQAQEALPEETEADQVDRLLGGRLVFQTPVDGLAVGLSSYAGKLEDADPRRDDWGDFASYDAHVEFDRTPWLVRAEIARHREDLFDTDAGYVEVSRRFGPHWQGALRTDRVRAKFVDPLPDSFDSLQRHDELSLGVSYWYNENLVLRGSYHRVDGNLFAHPNAEALAEAVASEQLDERTDLLLFGVQFSF
ncbi:MAG TPA: hypothetical protein VN851_22265 [Thermoanaerobaculia bacterium]|nr:hypothetical protein [Thermoanaerobaculia bacterium]